ncbi:MAG: ABC transporter permease subunit [Candidatus Rokubacteria bacterium]|nr:ABC transporter permease subunit [Candidatus Rokubacteria bacterium]
MAVTPEAEALRAGGPAAPARPRIVSRARTARRIRVDRWASHLVIVGGLVVIASILAILVVIVGEAWPLFRAPTAIRVGPAMGGLSAADARPIGALGVDEYREVAYQVTSAGEVALTDLRRGRALPPVPVPGLDGASVTRLAVGTGGHSLIGTSDGRVIPLEMTFDVVFTEGKRTVTPRPVFGPPSALDPERRPIQGLALARPESGPVVVAQLGPTDLVLQTVVERKALVGGSRREESIGPLPVSVEGEITALELDRRGEDLFIGTSRGQLTRIDLRDKASPRAAETIDGASAGDAGISALRFLIGDRTLVVGGRTGGVSSWQVIPPATGGPARLTRIYEFEGHPEAVLAIGPSARDKGFVTADASGTIRLHYGTSGRTLLTMQAEGGPIESVVIAPKADAVLAADTRGAVSLWRLNNPHPEVTLETLFGKVWYEGYSAPAYVWQSTGGTDDFEAKLSLTPLIYGTLKGTFYALLFAVPLALLAALYVSEFMHPDLKAYLKPVVEVMAALPSVVLGFLAGLWLAPLVERVVPGLFLMPLVQTACILGALLLWRMLPVRFRGRFRPGTEALLLMPVVVAGAWVAFALGGVVEAALLGGNYRGWLLSALGLTYDQRNSLVVGVAMGFAVIPIIFTIAEDSLANVPQHLRAGSLALGATRWQTALRIVLPTASPGIFSAVMIGFGRAVGETMIVLMATGNTPVMDWSIFNGFRALSANIAVELPEAPEQGTLFRVLFVAAFLLFCLTFVLNTVAELVRLRLRHKYRYL